MIDNGSIPDGAQRREALDPARSFIVQAPAGSGKTELLSQRYLRLLGGAQQPEEILAITFTRKAAGEMRHRILRALGRAADDTPPETPHERSTWRLAREALQRDTALGWNLSENPNRLRIQTIDALCGSITRQMPFMSGFGAQPGIAEDASVLYAEAARNTLDELENNPLWSDAIETLLKHLDNDYAKVEGLLADMLARRDQWLRHVVSGQGAGEWLQGLEKGLENLIEESLDGVLRFIDRSLQKEWLTVVRYAASNLHASGQASVIANCLDIERFPTAAAGDLDRWRGLGAVVLTAGGDWRRSLDRRTGFPPPSAAGTPGDRTLFGAMKQAAADLIERLARIDDFACLLHRTRSLPSARYREEQVLILQALYQLLPLAAAQLRLVFRARGQVDFAEVGRRALDALGDEGEPTDLALALDYRISHILVDEFQDTSLSQFDLLRRLTAGWQAGDGRTFFAVGDPMQSIYRFREAEVGLYLRARQEGIGDLRLQPLTLSVNFRSQQGIVEWVNTSFSRVFPGREDSASGAVAYAASSASKPPLPGLAVQVHPLLGRDDGDEAGRVLRIVSTDDSGGSIAVLVRSRAHLAAIVPRLRQAGLRFRAIEIEAFGQRPLVQDLCALTRALVHPGDRLAWLSVLRGPLCGLGLKDLHALAGGARRSMTVRSLMSDPLVQSGLEPHVQWRIARLARVFEERLRNRRRRGLRQQVEGAWLALGGPAAARDASDLEAAEVFFELLESLEEAGDLGDFSTLAERVGALYAPPDVDADDRLQIMTIHKAKGLEFDTVILPGLGRSPRPQGKRLLNWLERPRSGGGNDLLLAPLPAVGEDDDPVLSLIRELDSQKGAHEDGRLLYVATTRARSRLHLLGHTDIDEASGDARPPDRRTLLAKLWPVVSDDFQAAARAHSAEDSGEVAQGKTTKPAAIPVRVSTIRRPVMGWSIPEPPADVQWQPSAAEAEEALPDRETIEFEWAGETARRIGTVVHRLLQQIGRDGLDAWSPARVESMADHIGVLLDTAGVSTRALAEAKARVIAAIRGTLQDEKALWILGRHADGECEYPLTGLLDGKLLNAVIDRTFVDREGTRWIIDYKTGRHEGAGVEEFLDQEQARYRGQLGRYGALFRQRESRPIMLGLYYPLLGGWRSWPYTGDGFVDDRRDQGQGRDPTGRG